MGNATDRVRIVEIIAVVLTALLKFVFMDYLDWRLPFIVVAISCWVGYIVFVAFHDRSRLMEWGFRLDTIRDATRLLAPFALSALVACIVVGYVRETLNITWHIIPILILYPIWGTIQQYLLIALVAGNLHGLRLVKIAKASVILLTALVFALVHYPFGWLMAGTFMLAILYGFVFLKVRNIFVLGIFHGWLGAILFYTVVNRDPFVEVFGKYLSP